MNILKINKLSVKIGNFILNIDKLEIEKGEIFQIKGANGSGKTILLNTLLGFMEYSGELKINTTSIYGFVNNDFLVPYLTPKEYFDFIGKIHKISNYNLKCLELSRRFNLDLSNNKKYIRDLSEGNKKKVGIISILALDCEIMIFDEPFAYLDVDSCDELCKIFKEIGDKTIIYTSHENNDSLVPNNTYEL
jgi:ABC transporter related